MCNSNREFNVAYNCLNWQSSSLHGILSHGIFNADCKTTLYVGLILIMWSILLLLSIFLFTGCRDKCSETVKRCKQLVGRLRKSAGVVISLGWLGEQSSNSQRRPSRRCRRWCLWTSASWHHVKRLPVHLSSGGSPTPACQCQDPQRCMNQQTERVWFSEMHQKPPRLRQYRSAVTAWDKAHAVHFPINWGMNRQQYHLRLWHEQQGLRCSCVWVRMMRQNRPWPQTDHYRAQMTSADHNHMYKQLCFPHTHSNQRKSVVILTKVSTHCLNAAMVFSRFSPAPGRTNSKH